MYAHYDAAAHATSKGSVSIPGLNSALHNVVWAKHFLLNETSLFHIMLDCAKTTVVQTVPSTLQSEARIVFEKILNEQFWLPRSDYGDLAIRFKSH